MKLKDNESRGRKTHHFLPNKLGLSYASGMGCSKFGNCFLCDFPECKFNTDPKGPDIRFIANKGEGVKGW